MLPLNPGAKRRMLYLSQSKVGLSRVCEKILSFDGHLDFFVRHLTELYTQSQKKRTMDSSACPETQGQGHVTPAGSYHATDSPGAPGGPLSNGTLPLIQGHWYNAQKKMCISLGEDYSRSVFLCH